MVTALQAKVAAERLADPSVQRALANRAKAGLTATSRMGLDSSYIPSVDAALKMTMNTQNQNINQILSTQAATEQQKINPSIISMLQGGNSKMATAGQDLTAYQQIDTMFGGMLPGGVQPTAGGVAAAARIAGAATGTALIAGVGYAAYKYFTKNGQQRKTKANGQPYKQPRMNYANPKALARSERRMKSYIKHARKHVSAMGYSIKRKGSD